MTQRLYRRMLHSSVLADQWIYIDGGEVSYEKGKNIPINETLGIDLSINWTNSTLNLTTVPRPPTSLALNFQRLWWNKRMKVVYCYGGELSFGNDVGDSSILPPASIWGFTPDGQGKGDWTEVIGPTSAKVFPSTIIPAAAGVSAYDDFKGYYLGGLIDGATSSEVRVQNGSALPAPPGLLTYKFDTSAISNTSDGGYQGIYFPNGSYEGPGVMLNVPVYGVDGILILMGGTGSFNNLTIFDKHAQSWLSQTATGAIPTHRAFFCAVGIQASNDSYEIFIYGGRQTGDALFPDAVYILSLPAFQWFRADYMSNYPRFGHTCHSTTSGQMIVIGGFDASKYHYDFRGGWNDSADPWTQGIGVFDMSSLEWRDSYQANASSYTPPHVVKQFYNESTSRYPSQWASADVQKLFQPPSFRMNHGAIAGTVVGCLSFVILIGVVTRIFLKRKKKMLSVQRETSLMRKKEMLAVREETSVLDSNPLWEVSGAGRPWEMSDSGQLFELSQ